MRWKIHKTIGNYLHYDFIMDTDLNLNNRINKYLKKRLKIKQKIKNKYMLKCNNLEESHGEKRKFPNKICCMLSLKILLLNNIAMEILKNVAAEQYCYDKFEDCCC